MNVWQITKSTSKPKKRFPLEKFDPKHTDANGRSTSKVRGLLYAEQEILTWLL